MGLAEAVDEGVRHLDRLSAGGQAGGAEAPGELLEEDPNLEPGQSRPQAEVGALAKGDEAVTTGGLLGRITEVGSNFVKLEIAKGTEVKVQKHAIAQIMPKGTVKEM